MPVAPASRTLLRQSRFLLRRNNLNARQASTTAETASKAKETANTAASAAKESANTAVSKASEGLTRVQSSAGSAVSNVASGATNALKRVGGRTARMVSFVESLIPPTIYYTRVGMELSKLVFQGQKMAPPSISQFSSYFQPVTNALRNPSTITSTVSSAANAAGSASPEGILSRVRNVSRGEMITAGVVFAELLGFFTVGEMLGRMKIVGYTGEPAHGH